MLFKGIQAMTDKRKPEPVNFWVLFDATEKFRVLTLSARFFRSQA